MQRIEPGPGAPGPVHRIRRQVIEVEVKDTATAHHLQTELGVVVRRQVVPLLDRYLTAACRPGMLHRLDRLEITLGSLDPEHLERDLLAQLEAALPDQLEKTLGTPDPESQVKAGFELLDRFVDSGQVPWWADANRATLIGETVDQLADAAPRQLRSWLRRRSRRSITEPKPFRRLIRQLDDRRLGDLLELCGRPAWRSTLEALILSLPRLAVLRTEGGTLEPRRLRHAIWWGVLGSLSVEAGEAWRQMLARTAVELGVRYETWLDFLGQAGSLQNPALGRWLREERSTLQTSEASGRPAPSVAGPGSRTRLREGWQDEPEDSAVAIGLHWLGAFLQATEGSPGVGTVRPVQLHRAFEILLQRAPRLLLDRLRPLAASEASVERLVSHIDAAHRVALLRLLAPSAWLEGVEALIAGFVGLAELPDLSGMLDGRAPWEPAKAVHQGWHLMLRGLLAETTPPRIPLDRFVDRWVRRLARALEIDAATLARFLAKTPEVQHTTVATVLDPAVLNPAVVSLPKDPRLDSVRDEACEEPSEASDPKEAIPIEDGGLVLLWPFFEAAFEGLGWVEDRRFVDRACQHRAVALLGGLSRMVAVETGGRPGLRDAASNQSHPLAEYQLLLGKLLCGVELSEMLDPVVEWTPDEIAAGESLVQSALEVAPVLGVESVGAMRSTFLRRQALLSRTPACWLLRVERRPVDAVLDQLPWDLRWVHLPWMDALLRVEW